METSADESELFAAVRAADLARTRELLRTGADPHARDHSIGGDAGTPLHSVEGVRIAAELLGAGADVNARSASGGRP